MNKGISLMKKILSITLFASMIFAFMSCNNNNEDYFDGDPGEKGIVYSADVVISPGTGDKVDNVTTRGLDVQNGQFTNDYPYGYIYLHRADGIDGEGHESIRIPLDKTPDYCDGCRGIHLEVEVIDSPEGGYIVRNETGDEIVLKDDEEVYFSTIPDTYWETEAEKESPHGYDVFFQNQEKNTEILRSSNNYTKESLIELIQQGHPQIEMTRHCTAFRVQIMFTQKNFGRYIIDRDTWIEELGENYAPENFYIKIYVGPNFCHKFNLEENSVPAEDQGGYYTANEGQYTPFIQNIYAFKGGSGAESWEGFGYETALNNYLIAPLNTSDTRPFTVYAYVKYCPPGTDPNVNSDENAKWLEIPVTDFQVIPNRVHFIAIALNIDALKVFQTEANSILTRGLKNLEKIELKTPAKVICTYE